MFHLSQKILTFTLIAGAAFSASAQPAIQPTVDITKGSSCGSAFGAIRSGCGYGSLVGMLFVDSNAKETICY
jgi:hypothetical protein